MRCVEAKGTWARILVEAMAKPTPVREYAEVDRGMHRGDVRLRDRSMLLRGILSGDLHISGASDVELRGIVRGDVHLHGGTLLITGIVQGAVYNNGGVLTVRGLVSGATTTADGATTQRWLRLLRVLFKDSRLCRCCRGADASPQACQ